MKDIFSISPLKVGCGKFFHDKEVIGLLPSEIERLGGKALIIGGQTTLPLVMSAIKADLDHADISYQTITHTGQCTVAAAKDYAIKAVDDGFTVLVGVGGGKVIDEVKAASYFSSLPIITVPTSLATCVATSMVAIMYNDKGQREPAINLKKEIDVCLADENLIGTAPVRLLAAGILDDIAKMPESYYQKMHVKSYRDCLLEEYIQIVNSEAIYEFLMGEGRDLYDNGKDAKRFRDVILTNLLHTSIVSGFADGSGQLAIAHATYDYMRTFNTEKAADFLHGELVAVGLLVQMAYNGYPDAEIQKVKDLMSYMHMPLNLHDICYDTSSESLDQYKQYVMNACDINGADNVKLLEKAIGLIL